MAKSTNKSPKEKSLSVLKTAQDVLLCSAIFAGLHLFSHEFGLNLALAFVLILILEVVNRGNRWSEDLLVGFVAIFGLVPVFGWIDLPSFFNPVIAVCTIWIFILLRFPKRNVRNGLVATTGPVSSFLFTYFWWHELTLGGPINVFSRLFPIWDMSAHFYFFIANLEHNKFIPLAKTPLDLGHNKWAGVEYPTGIHYVWTRLATSHSDAFLAKPTEAIPFFATSVVFTYAVCLGIIAIAVGRACADRRYRWHTTFFSFGLSTFSIGLGVLSQTITSGFVNIAVVLAACAVIASLLINPLTQGITQNLALGSSVLVIAYNWYPVLLLVAPAMLVFLILQCRQLKLRAIISFLLLWIGVTAVGVAPIIQTFSLGITHLTVDGGVQAIAPSISILILLGCGLFCLLQFKNLSIVNRTLLISPAAVHISFFLFFRITEGDFRYYFQKINIFTVLFALCVLCVSLVDLVTKNLATKPFLDSRKSQLRNSFVVLLCTLLVTYIFGYIGPDSEKFAGDDSLTGLARKSRTTSVDPISQINANIISRAAEQIIDLPIDQKAWAMLALPKRLTKTQPNDGSVIILSNVWLHSLSKSQTLTAFETSYVAGNLEIRKSLLSDDAIAKELPNIFQPDSVTVFSTNRVISLLKGQAYKWKTIEFKEDSLNQ